MHLERAIRSALVWMRLSAFAGGMARGALAAAGCVFAAVCAQKFILTSMPWHWVWAAALAAVLAGGLAGLLASRLTPVRAALALDERYALRERLVTAHHARSTTHPFRDAILADAELCAARLDPRQAAAPPSTRPAWAAGIVACCAGILFLAAPETDLLGRKAHARARENALGVAATEAKKMSQLQQKLALSDQVLSSSGSARQLRADLAELQRELFKTRPESLRDTMAKMSTMAEKVEKQKEKMREEARAAMGPDRRTTETGAQTERLARALRRGDARAAADELKRLEQKASGNQMDDAQKKAMGDDISRLADSLGKENHLGKALDQAANGLRQADATATRQGFAAATQELDKAAQTQAELEKLDETLAGLDEAKSELARADNALAAAGANAGMTSATASTGTAAARNGKPCQSCGGKGCSSCNGTGQSQQQGQGKGQEGKQGQQAASAGASAGQSASQQGKGSGAQQGTGDGSGADWGVGSTNLATEGGYNVQAKPGSNRQASRDSNWTEEFVKLYDPRSIDTKNVDASARGKMGEGTPDHVAEFGGEGRREAPRAEITKSFMDYREQQKDAMSGEDIPLGYKEHVKSYFDSIEPPR